MKKKLKKRSIQPLGACSVRSTPTIATALLLIFQAMDAAGKDSTIRTVMSGVNPAGFQVYAFKQPSKEELDHDFLWRSARCALPERGRIGMFNRSYYEEVLVVRVHPEYLGGQKLPRQPAARPALAGALRVDSATTRSTWRATATTVVKFFLNVSREEQHRRFVARIDEAREELEVLRRRRGGEPPLG